MNPKSKQLGFTLIEIMIVVSIIGFLASVVFTSLYQSRAKARDTKRKEDLVQLQKGLEIYYSTNNGYPTTGGVWFAATGGCGGSFGYSGATGYIPNLAPTFVGQLPADPKPDASTCSGFNYRSDGINYKLISNAVSGLGGPETFPTAGEMFYDPARPTTGWMVTNNNAATILW